MLLNAARAEMCRPPIDLACVRSVLPVEQLGARAPHRPRDRRSQRSRRARRTLHGRAFGEVSRADRCLAGGTTRRGRPDPRLRPLSRGRPIPRPPCGCRDRCEHDRHGVPAGTNDRRAAAQPLARTPAQLQRSGDPRHVRDSRQRGHPGHNGAAGAASTRPLATGWRKPQRTPARHGAAPLRRQPERHDRSADRPALRAEQPRARCSAMARAARRRSRAGPPRSLPLGARKGADSDRRRGGHRQLSGPRHVRSRPTDARPHSDPGHAAPWPRRRR